MTINPDSDSKHNDEKLLERKAKKLGLSLEETKKRAEFSDGFFSSSNEEVEMCVRESTGM